MGADTKQSLHCIAVQFNFVSSKVLFGLASILVFAAFAKRLNTQHRDRIWSENCSFCDEKLFQRADDDTLGVKLKFAQMRNRD